MSRTSPQLDHGFRALSPGQTRWAAMFFLCAAALLFAPYAPAQKVETCNNPDHILPAGDQDTDLQITGGVNCIVNGTAVSGLTKGVYVYRNVNVWNGTLTFADAQIDFHAHSILVELGGTLQAGASSPVNGPVTIWLWGSKTDGIPSITCKSDAVTCGVPTGLWNSNQTVVNHQMPTMKCKPASDYGNVPAAIRVSDCFYQYEVLDKGDIAGAYFGRKVLAVSAGGSLLLRGAKGIRNGVMEANPADSGTSWVRLTETLKGGGSETTLYTDRLVPSWRPGDEIVLTPTDYLPSHTEELVIDKVTPISDTEDRIDLTTAVNYPHNGAAYDFSDAAAENPNAGPAPDPNVTNLPPHHIETRAIIALLTRSIIIASEGAFPQVNRGGDHFPATAGNYYGGHTLVREGFNNFQVQGVEFYQLGQGGAAGRYPVHFHMARGVPQPNPTTGYLGTFVADSTVYDSMTRFMTIHATQGITLARNVGYLSIGHGFYLEDATETNNRIYSNVGMMSRGAVAVAAVNPRMVPGILDLPAAETPQPKPPLLPIKYGPGVQIPDIPPYFTDVTNPSVFWIMNTWNDFEYNVAVGAGTCGACYWMPPGGISGNSQYETWTGYASMQKTLDNFGEVPLLTFKGNACTTSMNGLQTVGATAYCNGVFFGEGVSDDKHLVSVVNPNPLPFAEYPRESGGQHAKTTICDAAHQEDCSKTPPCTGEGIDIANCAATVFDHFTTSFNWAQTNFAAVWLRNWWNLVTDAAITDVQNAGITFVTGGGYTRSDAAQGFWSVLKNSVLVGNTQDINPATGVPDNPAASNAGPFNPYALKCPYSPLYCLSLDDGIAFQGSNFGVNQRLFSIYDGPATEYNNIYSDVHVTPITTLEGCRGKGGNNNPGECQTSGWMNGYVQGVLQSPPTNQDANKCVLPNAAIAWKQPNGFYYPPAFHSDNLVFSNVDIRHFVIQPLYLANSFNEDLPAIRNTYCSWQIGMFKNTFTDIDRQTELSDDDGSLTGLTALTQNPGPAAGPSISVTKDPFFNAPLVTDECASAVPGTTTPTTDGATVDTSPYEYLTTAITAPCALLAADNPLYCGNVWIQVCTNPSCYGVPLYRQSLTTAELSAYGKNKKTQPVIRMMGQANPQRSTLSLNHASYYIDTTVSADAQRAAGQPLVNEFLPGRTYDIFFVFARTTTKQTYSMYIGKKLTQADAKATIKTGRVGISSQNFPFKESSGSWARFGDYDEDTGLLTIDVDLSGQSDLLPANREAFCQPKSYCQWQQDTKTCGCKPESNCTDSKVCSYAVADLDCPVNGCYGFSIKLPEAPIFAAVPQPNLPPAPETFLQTDPYFGNVGSTPNVNFVAAKEATAGSCHYAEVPKPNP